MVHRRHLALVAFVLAASLLAWLAGSPSPVLAIDPAPGNGAVATPTDQWAVKLQPGADPNQVAAQAGAVNLGPIGPIPQWYLFRRPVASLGTPDRLLSSPQVISAQQVVLGPTTPRDAPPTDPLYSQQWTLRNTGQDTYPNDPEVPQAVAGNDLNVVPAWAANLTGSGITVQVIDDGVEFDHPELSGTVPGGATKVRTDLSANWVNNPANQNDPPQTTPTAIFTRVGGSPVVDSTGSAADAHGTAVVGSAVATANNAKCGAGVAYNARLASSRVYGTFAVGTSNISAAREAMGVVYQIASVDISNNSWVRRTMANSTVAIPSTVRCRSR